MVCIYWSVNRPSINLFNSLDGFCNRWLWVSLCQMLFRLTEQKEDGFLYSVAFPVIFLIQYGIDTWSSPAVIPLFICQRYYLLYVFEYDLCLVVYSIRWFFYNFWASYSLVNRIINTPSIGLYHYRPTPSLRAFHWLHFYNYYKLVVSCLTCKLDTIITFSTFCFHFFCKKQGVLYVDVYFVCLFL